MDFKIAFVAIVSMIGFYGLIAIIITAIWRTKQRSNELQAEVQTKLIDRFGSAPELIDFLQSEAGHQFIEGFHSAPRYAAREKILGGLRRGIITSLLGLGFLALFAADYRENWGFIYPGCLILSLGIGFFLSTFVSMKLSRSWGLIDDRSESVVARS